MGVLGIQSLGLRSIARIQFMTFKHWKHDQDQHEVTTVTNFVAITLCANTMVTYSNS